VKLNVQQHAGSGNGDLLPPEDLTGVEEGTFVPFEQHWDSEGEEELSEIEADVIFEAEKLAMDEQDEDTEDLNDDLGEDSDIDTESDQEGSNDDPDYIPSSIRGSHGHFRVSRRVPGASKLSKTLMLKQAANERLKENVAYIFCPLPHRPPILRLLAKHFCQHPLLPERHGQPRSSDQIYRDAVYEAYLHCKNNHLHEVWAYLWTNWYARDKWRLWARSAYPHAIPRKRTTMVVEAMWRNLKRLVLHLHNRPRVDFATYALVTQALPGYRNKVVRILDDPREGRAATLHGEQIPIKKAWLILRNRESKGTYDTDVLHWTCSCGAQKYHSYLLCKHLVQAVRCPDANWWATVVRLPTPPFYNVLELLSPEDRARAPKPQEHGNRSWLARQLGHNAPTVSPEPVCLTYF